MNEAEKLWAIHIPGPDDVFAMANKDAAHTAATEHNEAVVASCLAERTGLPEACLLAKVIEWPHDSKSHAASLESRRLR